MPEYETRSESGRIRIRLKCHQLTSQDLQDYGAINRSDQQLQERALYHVAQMQAHLPTPQAVLADDIEAFTRLLGQYYARVYKGLLVGYTGMKDTFSLKLEPRYTTTVNFDDSENELAFTGLSGLQTLLKKEQDQRRQAACDDGESSDAYVITMIQVTIYDAQEDERKWYEKLGRYVCYNVVGDQITTAYEQINVSDDVLRGLGLPFVETTAFV